MKVLLVLLLVLAGCSGAPLAPENEPAPSVITDPRDLLNGTAPGSHIHDYWNGRDSVEVLGVEGGQSGSTCSGGCAQGISIDDQRPTEGAIVPQGTRWVNGTFTHHSDGEDDFSRLELWVKTAKDTETRRVAEIQSGQPFSIDSSQEQNDPPHYVLSLWQFEVRAFDDDGSIHAGGRFDWAVAAVRGLPLTPYPPHPDRWRGETELELLEESGSTQLSYNLENPQGGTSRTCYNGCPGTHILPNGTVVPYGTERVDVRLTLRDGAPTGLGLWYHGADTWAETKAEGEMVEPGTYLYVIRLEQSMADSPYAPQSLWQFRLWIDQPQPVLSAWSGAYDIGVKALRT